MCHFVLCFSVLLVLRLPRLGKRELILALFVRLFGFCLFRFVGFLFLLGSGKGCGLWLWHSLDFSLTFFCDCGTSWTFLLPFFCTCCNHLICQSTIISSINHRQFSVVNNSDLDWKSEDVIYMFYLAAKEAEECSMLDRPNGPLKQGLRNICLKSKKQRKLIRFLINISGELVIHDHLVKFWFNLLKKIKHKSNSTERFKNILRHELELKWNKRLQTPFPLGFNDNIYHEGNISKMPDFDVFSLLDIKKRNKRSHGKRKNGNFNRKHKTVLSLFYLNILFNSGRHPMFSKLASLSISSLRKLDDEANKFYERKHYLYEAALLTRCYTKHALRLYIGYEINHIRHFIKIPFINKGIEFSLTFFL